MKKSQKRWKKKRLWYVIDCKRSLLFLLILLSLLLLSSLLYCHCYCYYDYRHAHFRGIIHVQSATANSARHSCFYFLSVAMEREDSRKKKRKKERTIWGDKFTDNGQRKFSFNSEGYFPMFEGRFSVEKVGNFGKKKFRKFYEILEILSRTKNREINSRIIDLLDVRYFSSLKNIVTFDSSFYQSIYSICKL